MNKSVSIVLPTYNEEANIGLLIEELDERLFGPLKGNIRYIVVDDRSTDGTINTIKKLCGKNDRIELILRTGSRSLGKSILEGLKAARSDFILIMDTDFNHPPRYCHDMILEAKKGHAIVGSRFISGGGMDYGIARYCGSSLVQGLMRLITGIQCKELLSGFICIHREDILPLIQNEKLFDGYGEFFIYMLMYLQKTGVEIREIPVVYDKRRYGTSKTRLLRYAVTVLRASWNARWCQFS